MTHPKILTVALSVAVLAIACEKKAAETDESGSPKAVQPETPADPIAAVMKPYEACRALLAGDKGDGVADCANSMAGAAAAGKTAAPDTARGHLDAIAKASADLAKVPASDMAQLRKSYGEVSEHVVALLSAVPDAAEGYHVFECPMAKGYKRWAQPNAELANPYMGTKMLECGSEVHDHHGGAADEPPTEQEKLADAEIAAYEAAKPVFEEHCATCHTTVEKPSKKRKKALDHFVMDTYPFGGHHAAELGATVREVLGVDGGKPTMPKDDPGAVKGGQLELVIAWSRASDAAHPSDAEHDHEHEAH